MTARHTAAASCDASARAFRAATAAPRRRRMGNVRLATVVSGSVLQYFSPSTFSHTHSLSLVDYCTRTATCTRSLTQSHPLTYLLLLAYLLTCMFPFTFFLLVFSFPSFALPLCFFASTRTSLSHPHTHSLSSFINFADYYTLRQIQRPDLVGGLQILCRWKVR